MMLLQNMIDSGRFSESIEEIGRLIYEEKLHNMRWDFWLHRVYDMTFDEYVQTCESSSQTNNCTIEDTLEHSFNMMENFHPD